MAMAMMKDKLHFRRRLRQEQTDAERKLWSLLRSRQLEAYKFRRQHTIGPYIVDFCCLERRLIIELDGGHHAEQIDKDNERSQFLEKKGYRVLRVWNNDLFKQTSALMDKILMELDAAQHNTSARAETYGWKHGL